jgi:hypothetical protein
MTALFVFVVVFAVLSFLLYRLLKALGRAYGRAAGAAEPVRRQTSWLKPMSGERAGYQGTATELTAIERILAGVVILVFAIFEVWFFFFSGSPYNYGSPSRSAHPAPIAQVDFGAGEPALAVLESSPDPPSGSFYTMLVVKDGKQGRGPRGVLRAPSSRSEPVS